MQKATIDRTHQGLNACDYLGYNLIKGIEPKVRNAEGVQPPMKNSKGKWDDKAHLEMTVEFDADHHIDIFGDGFTIVYDLGKVMETDGAFISGESRGGDYILGNYELFVSLNEDDLFDDKNRVIEVDNEGVFSEHGGERCAEAFINFGKFYETRYFGMRVNRTCAKDDIARIAVIELYNSTITQQYCFTKKNFDVTLLDASSIEILGDYSGNIDFLVDGETFNGKSVKLNGNLILEPLHPAKTIMLTGLFEGYKIYTSDNKDDLFNNEVAFSANEVETSNEEKSHALVLDEYSKKYIGISFDNEAVLDEIGAYTYCRYANIELDNVRTENFIGIGGNELPMAKMPESRMKGYREVFWPIYEHRIIKSKPSVLRLWFQPDWVVDNEEDYMAGNCNFKTLKMRSIFDYLDAYEKAGVEVEFNYGWKASTDIQDWFSLEWVGNHPKDWWLGKSASVPKNFDGFAKCAAAVLKEIFDRGYTCVKYFTLYNESGYGDTTAIGADYLGFYGQAKQKWEEMMRKCIDEINKAGLEGKLEYWLAEESGNDDLVKEWLDYMSTKCKDINHMNTYHRYWMQYKSRIAFMKELREAAHGMPIVTSEFAVYGEGSWEQSNVEYAMSMMRAGTNGGLYWIYQGAMATDPTWMYLRGSKHTNWWCPPYEDDGLTSENVPYHEFNLITRYCPAHSNVLESNVDNEDTRVEVIETPDGNYTVFVESKAGKFPKEISLNFNKKVNKTFRKHVYRPKDLVLDGNLMVPAVEAEFQVEDVLHDNIGDEYCFIAYTTCPPLKQVKMDGLLHNITLGEKIQLNAQLVDCDDELVWEIVSCDGPESHVDQNGLFTAMTIETPTDEKYHFNYCVKASLKSDPLCYGVTMVRVHTKL